LEPGAASRRREDTAPFHVFTVAATPDTGRATGGLRVVPDYSLVDAPPIELLVVPGGFGPRPLLEDRAVLDWIRGAAAKAEHVTSVCTGALLLAKAGLLEGRKATTHHAALDLLAEIDPSVQVDRNARVVQDGVISSAGVAAGIDMAFDVVEMLHGRDVADETAHYIEYPRGAAHDVPREM
jgi:transcriptional regulator GlxA family with amidase domain